MLSHDSHAILLDSLSVQVPLGPKRLLRNMKSAKASTMKTCELQEHSRKQGFRLVSHQHMPESLKPGLFASYDYSDNLYTFLRPVGHRIRRRQARLQTGGVMSHQLVQLVTLDRACSQDRDSKLLARLRLGLPAHLCNRRKDPQRLCMQCLQCMRAQRDFLSPGSYRLCP